MTVRVFKIIVKNTEFQLFISNNTHYIPRVPAPRQPASNHSAREQSVSVIKTGESQFIKPKLHHPLSLQNKEMYFAYQTVQNDNAKATISGKNYDLLFVT